MEGGAEDERVAAVVAAMLLDTEDADTQRNGCRELMNLSTGDAPCAQAIVHTGGVAAVVAAMRQHAEDAVLQRFGCGALMNLSCGDGACEQAIVDAGGVKAVVAAMGQHAEDVEVQRFASYALLNMTLGGIACTQAIVDGGGVAAVVAALGQHPTDSTLQICGSGALGSLAVVCEQAIVDGGGVSALVAAIRWNPKVAGGAAAKTLTKLAADKAANSIIATAVLEEVARTETDCSSWDGLQEVLRECALARLQTAEEGADVAPLEHAITMAAAVQVDAAALEHARERVREMHADAERQVELESYGLGSLGTPKEFLCPITLQKMRDPVVASDGHSYERSAILSVLRDGNGLSPLTRDPLQATVFANFALKWRIQIHEADMLRVVSKAVANATRAQNERQRQMQKELGELTTEFAALQAMVFGPAAK